MIVKDVQGSPGSTGAGLCQYIAESGIERELDADGARSLFSDDSDSLTVDQANHLLGRAMEIEKGELVHVVISLRAEEFESLGESESERREELTAFVREAVRELAEELKVDNLEYAAAIHRNTPNPHVHLAVSRFARSIETQRLVRIDHLPRDLWSRRDDDGSRTPFRERLYDAFEARTRERRDRDRDDNGRDTEHEPLPAPTSPERVVAGPHLQPREYQLTERSDPVAESSPKGDASSTDAEQTRDQAGDDGQPQPNGDETRREVASASPSEWADPRLRPNLVTEILAARERARAGGGAQPSRAPATAQLPSGARAISDRAIAETLGRRLAAELRAKHAAWLLDKVQSRRDVLRYEVSERRVSADGTVRSVNRILSPNDVARRAEARAQGSAGRQSFERSVERDQYLADAYHREIDRDIPTVAEIDERHDAHVADLEAKLEKANASLERTLAETAWAAGIDPEARRPHIASSDLARLERQALSRQDTGDFRMLDGLRTGAREPEDTGLLRGTARVATTSRASAERRLSDFERDRHSRRVEIRGEHVSLATLDRERLRLEKARDALDRGLVHLAASRDSRLGPLPRLAARLIEPVGRATGVSSPLAELRSVEAELARNERDRVEADVLLDGKHADLASDLDRARQLENALGVAIGREVEYARAEGRDLAPEVLRPFEAQRIEADAITRRDPELLRDIAETTDQNLSSELAAARRAEGRALAAETLVLAARERQERFEFFDTVVPVRIRERDGSESFARARDDAPAPFRLAPVDRNRPPTGDTLRDVVTGRVSVELSAGALARRIFARPAERERMERVTEAVAAERDRLASELAEAKALAGAAREIADRRLEEAKSAKIDERSVREAPVFLVEEAAEMERYLVGARPSADVERLSSVLEDAIDSSRVVRPDVFDRIQSPGEARDSQRPDSLDRRESRRVSPSRSVAPDRSESPTRSAGDQTRTTESVPRFRNIADGTRENSRTRLGETPTRSAEGPGGRSPGLDRTLGQMRAQIRALGGTVEIGIGNGRGAMQQRVITTADIERVAGYLRHSNARGSHIYVRPTESIGLVLMDDVRRDTLDQLRRDGLAPAAIVETSPGNHQAWIRLSDKPIERDLASAAARDLARTYGTDERGAAWNHYGRLAGFTNPKPQYAGERGFPFSELRGSSGQVAERGAAVLDRARSALELERTIERAHDLSRPSAPERPAPTAPDPDPKASYDRVAALAPRDVAADRSRLDWRVATTLSREGRERDWIRSAIERGNDGIADRGKSPGYVDRTVDKAMRETSRSIEREPSRDR